MKLKIRNGLIIILGVTAFVAIFLLTSIFIYFEIKDYNYSLQEFQRYSVNSQKKELVREVERAIDYIEYIRTKYSNKSDSTIKSEVLSRFEKIRFGNGGYIFVNTFSGKPLIFDGKIISDEKSILDMTDPDGKKLFFMELDAANNENGGFMEYKFKKMNTDIIFPKLAFIKGYSEWEWIIGAGEYTENLSLKTEEIRSSLINRLKLKIIRTLLVSALIAILVLYLALIVTWRVKKELKLFASLFSHQDLKINSQNLQNIRIEELSEIASIAMDINLNKNETILNSLLEKDKYKLLVDNSVAGMFIIKNDSIVFCNAKFAAYFEYDSSDNLLNRNIYSFLHPDDKELLHNSLSIKSIEGSFDINLIIRGLTKYNKIIILNLKGVLVKNENIFILYGNILDITKYENDRLEIIKYRNNLEILIKERTADLESKNAELTNYNDELNNYNEILVKRELEIKELKNDITNLISNLNQYK